MAEEKRGDAELELPALGDGPGRPFGLLPQRLGHLAQRTILRLALCQPLTQLLYGSGIAILSFHEQSFQIDEQRLHHDNSFGVSDIESGALFRPVLLGMC